MVLLRKKPNPKIIYRRKLGATTREFRRRRTLCAHAPTLLLSIRRRNFTSVSRMWFRFLKTKQIAQRGQGIRSAHQVLSPKENYWRPYVRRTTINPTYELCYRYRSLVSPSYNQAEYSTSAGNQERKLSTISERGLIAPMCLPGFRQSGVEIRYRFPGLVFNSQKPNPNIHL